MPRREPYDYQYYQVRGNVLDARGKTVGDFAFKVDAKTIKTAIARVIRCFAMNHMWSAIDHPGDERVIPGNDNSVRLAKFDVWSIKNPAKKALNLKFDREKNIEYTWSKNHDKVIHVKYTWGYFSR